MTKLLSAACFVVSCVVVSGADDGAAPSAGALLERAARRYATCVSYRDEGVVTASVEGIEQALPEQPFRTLFQRGGSFRFDWQILSEPGAAPRKCSVWASGGAAYSFWQPDQYFRERSLASAVARATGVSAGAAHTIPRLLISDLRGKALTTLENLELLREEAVAGVPCHVLKGMRRAADPIQRPIAYELWIGKDDALIRRVRMRTWARMLKAWTVTEENRTDIKVDSEIPATEFDVAVPSNVQLKERGGLRRAP